MLVSAGAAAPAAKQPKVDIVGFRLGMKVKEVLKVVETQKAIIITIAATELDKRYGGKSQRQWGTVGKNPLDQASEIPWDAVSSMDIDLLGVDYNPKTVEEMQALQRRSLATDRLTLTFALFPDANRVLNIQRTTASAPDERTSLDLFRESLVQKYGAATTTNELKNQGAVCGLQATWVYPANASSCYAGAGWSMPDRGTIERNLKISADACGTVLAFSLTGNPVSRAESRLTNVAGLLQNAERNEQYLKDWRQKQHDEAVKNAVTAPAL